MEQVDAICLSFFLMQLLVYPATVFFSWYARDAGFSHMYTEFKTAFAMQCEDPFLGWGLGGATISILITRHYFHFFFFSIDLIKFCFTG